MFEDISLSVATSLIENCGKKCIQRIILNLKKNKIKKKIRNFFEKEFLGKIGENVYYDALYEFLCNEKFVDNITKFSFDIKYPLVKNIDSYVEYVVEYFISDNNIFRIYKNDIRHFLYLVCKSIFDFANDYTNNEETRIIVQQLSNKLNDLKEEINLKLNKILSLLNAETTDSKKVDLNNNEYIVLYKKTLKADLVSNDNYIARNIYSNSDDEKTTLEVLLNNKKVLLLGEPGCGKTFETLNLLKQICIGSEFENFIPIYINLIEYGIVYESIYAYIKKNLSPYFGEITDEQINVEMLKGKFILILDGVDEIKIEHRIKFYSDINTLMSFDKLYAFITSRGNIYRNNIKNVMSYYINDLSVLQIENELKKNNIDILLGKKFHSLFVNPLFLKIGINVLKQGKLKNIYNKSQLIYAYIEELCYKRDLDKQLFNGIDKNLYTILMSIGALAFEKFEKSIISVKEFDEFFHKKNEKYNVNNIIDLFRLEVFTIKENIIFAHKQFKEYFAAFYLVNEYNITEHRQLYEKLIKNDDWNEVFIFATGMIDDFVIQNLLLDLILENNLELYIKCINSKNDFSEELSNYPLNQYAKTYLNILFKSYNSILQCYFGNIIHKFEPYYTDSPILLKDKKICLIASFSIDRKGLNYFFDWRSQDENDIQLINESELSKVFKELESRAISERRSNITTRFINLEMSNMMGDSARKLALDIIYDQLIKIIENVQLHEDMYVMYERLIYFVENRMNLKGKTLVEINDFINGEINKYYENDQVESNIIYYNNINLNYLSYITNLFVEKGLKHEDLTLPGPDLPIQAGWIWDCYSKEQVIKRIEYFFKFRQLSFEEIIKLNFPTMNKYFLISKNSPYKYIIYLKFNSSKDMFSDHTITYYRLSIKENEDNTPNVIVCNEENLVDFKNLYDEIIMTNYLNGKDSQDVSITTSRLSMILTARGKVGPLTSIVYDDIKKCFKSLFKR